MFEPRIDVGFLAKSNDLFEMLMIHVGVDTEQPLENQLSDGEKITRELPSDLAREHGLVLHLVIDPGHQEVDVARGGALDGHHHALAVSPVILILGPGAHDWTRDVSAAVRQGPHQHRDLVDEVHDVVGHPLVEVLALGKHHGHPEVAGAEGRRSVLREVSLVRAVRDILLGFEIN